MSETLSKSALVVGLTGGIGSGKSTVAKILERRGAAIVDADALAREIVKPGEPALEEIRERFGPRVIAQDGSLDRPALAEIVFEDEEARRDLEAITHPRIADLARRRMEEHAGKGTSVVIYEAALIVELGLQRDLDGLIVVSAEPEVQVERVVRRDHAGPSEVERRLRAQLPLPDKVRVADWVVDNSGTLDETEARIDELWEALRDAAEKKRGARQQGVGGEEGKP